MAVDLNRILQAAVEAGLQGGGSSSKSSNGSEQKSKRGLTMPRAFLLGAGVVTAGRLVAGSRGRDMLENLQERLVEYEHQHFGGEEPDEEPQAEEDEDFDEGEEDEEPYDEEDEDFEEEPEAEEDEDFDEEPEAEEDEDFDEEESEEERPRRVRSGSGSGRRRVRR